LQPAIPGIVLSVGQFRDVERGVAKRDERLPAWQYDRIEKMLIPRHEIPIPDHCPYCLIS
jgi:hypothetical protein